MTSSAWVPIEPVLPSISTRVLLTDLLCRVAVPAAAAECAQGESDANVTSAIHVHP
jgi:hypothetical protein